MKDDKKEGFKFFRLIKIKMTDETQPKTSFLRRASRIIPAWGLYDYTHSGDEKKDYKNGRYMGRLPHALNIGLSAAYLIISLGFNSLNPVKWIETSNRLSAQNRQAYDDLSNQLFGTNGLADVNTNGVIESGELLDAFSRCGMLRQPTESDLRRGIDSYKQK